jgi:predicted dehydrogenase
LRTKKGDTEITPRGGNYNLFYANISDALNEGNELLIKPEEVRLVIFILEAAFLSAATGQAVPLRPPTGGNG